MEHLGKKKVLDLEISTTCSCEVSLLICINNVLD